MAYCRTRTNALKRGSTYYKTGNPCSRGHLSKRYARTGRCFECDKLNKKSRYDRLKQCTPSWANSERIDKIYELARSLGKWYHVDHVIPINGEKVTGLHVHNNLKIIRGMPNLRKGNRFTL